MHPTGYAYSTLLNAHVLAGDLAGGASPSTTSFSELSFFSSGDLAGGARVFEAMMASKCRPNLVVYTTMLKGFCAAGDMTAAVHLINSVVSFVS